ncbi:MAG: hypothetical protein ACOYI5_02760 [Christensenellales bacterium]|jgi:peptidoglycan/LPS O-acetylase OafA/YrhL
MDEIRDYETARRRAEGNERIRRALMTALTLVVLIYLGLIYSLMHIQPGDAEYYVSIFTLILNTLLFAGMLIAAYVLKRRYARYQALMQKYAQEDKADPWMVSP